MFDIDNLFPTQPGGSVFLEYDYMDQNKNWSGLSGAPAANNDDKDIRTSFYTAGFQYLFASGFGVMAEVPYWNRHFATNTGRSIDAFDHSALGDIRLTGVYSGFSADNSTGLTLGIKLPTGDHNYANFDRDTEIGSGSTDLSFGASHIGTFGVVSPWHYFVQGRYQFSVATTGGYRPGNELNGVAGVSYDAGTIGEAIDVAPILQLIGSIRSHDSGPTASPTDSGYSRLLLSPGVDLNIQSWSLHAEVDLPIYQNIIGNQLIAQQLIKTNISYRF
ncbi:MAG: hypothetical protein P4L57_12300 [Rhizomicrobium sp.]|nr:hypothetical protein [Rhizomicrobium sp.]